MRIPPGSIVWRGVLLIALLVSLLSTAATPRATHAQSIASEPAADRHATPLDVVVSMDTLPSLNTSADVAIDVSSTYPASRVIVDIVVSADVRIDGESTYVIDLKAGEKRRLHVRVTPTAAGNQTVAANVRRDFGGGNVWGDTDAVYFFSDDGSAAPGFAFQGDPLSGAAAPGPGNTMRLASDAFADGTTEALPHDEHTPIPVATGEPGSSAAVTERSRESSLAGTITIRGNTGMFARNGYWRGQMVLVELIAKNGGTMRYTYSNSNGDFAFTVNNPGQFRLRVWANYRHESMTVGAIRVVGKGFPTPDTFSVGGWHYNIPTMGPFADGEVNIGAWGPAYDWEGRRAWWVYQDLVDGFVFPWFKTLPGTPPGTQLPDGVTVEWEPDSIDGAYYDTIGRRVHLANWDADSRHTVLHEYGHAVMHNIYGGYFPVNDCPNPHEVNRVSAPTCAWTEGWATFFAMSVTGDPVYKWGCALPCTPYSMNLETTRVESEEEWDDGDTVEGNVAAALWDLTDPWIDGLDKTNSLISPFSYVWSIIFVHDMGTFRNFWTSWTDVFYFNNTNTLASLYHNTIDYGWSACPDYATEPDDSHLGVYQPIDIAAGPVSRSHCTDGDADFIRFNVKAGGAYTIETMNLGDTPAGTFGNTAMTLYSMSQFGGLTELAHDDDSGTENLASKIVHTATTDGIWFAKVTSTRESGHFAYTYDVDVSVTGTDLAPTVTAPTHELVVGRAVTGSPTTGYSISLKSAWTATDPDDGIATQKLEKAVNGRGFSSVASSLGTTTRSYNVPVRIGTTNKLRITATDTTGASSQATGNEFTVRGRQETTFSYTGSWTSHSASTAWGGSFRRTNGGSDVKAVYRFTGSDVALIGSKRRDGGRAEIYIDGSLAGTLDFYSPTSKNRQVLFVRSGLSNTTHTLEVRWISSHDDASSGYRLYVDGGISLSEPIG